MEQYLKICYEFQMDPIRLELEQIWATIAEERAQRQRLVTELQAALAGLPVDDLTPLGFGVTPAPPAPPVADLEEVIVEAPPPVPSVAVPVTGPPPSAADLSAGGPLTPPPPEGGVMWASLPVEVGETDV